MDNRTQQFLQNLYDEKLKHKDHRNTFVLRKLFFVITLFGLGSVPARDVELYFLLYFVPFVAQAYDIYIFAEDFKVKRVGIFVTTMCRSSCSDETTWETWVSAHREPLAAYASLLLTLLSHIAAAFILYFKELPVPFTLHFWLFAGWVVVSIVLTAGVFAYARRLERTLAAAGKTGRPAQTRRGRR